MPKSPKVKAPTWREIKREPLHFTLGLLPNGKGPGQIHAYYRVYEVHEVEGYRDRIEQGFPLDFFSMPDDLKFVFHMAALANQRLIDYAMEADSNERSRRKLPLAEDRYRGGVQ